MIEIANKAIKSIESKSIIGRDISKNNIIFHGGYSKIFLFETRESKNKNIKNAKNGRNIKIPIIFTIGLG